MKGFQEWRVCHGLRNGVRSSRFYSKGWSHFSKIQASELWDRGPSMVANPWSYHLRAGILNLISEGWGMKGKG